MRFLVYVLVALGAGILAGHFYAPEFGNLYEVMLYLLILIIGIDLGQSFRLAEIRKLGRLAIKLPLGTLLGSLLGGIAASLILGIELRWGLAVAAGCGWYSLAGPLIAQYSTVYGTLGFLANLTREIFTVLLYPVAIGKMRKELAVSMGGATTMDTTLPIMTKFGGSEVALIAFVHGFVLTALVPFVVPFILQLLAGG
ncbi:membrane protein, conserved [Thermococcus sp. 4557]|uniref:lysine exporter LysO family protein n=1 Tax=Thermococcus sp. (strain CGMCC 1.5172 / 4557) TaxID=1042877 RepID=UPI000219E99C|nr:lysine exporter LysO family protein [Thermococcus sp. 4557]AEK72706.1 membrane protein, conserved [Thermococcus sp. 4557]